MSRRRFGAVRKLPSGRWQVRYRHPATDRYRTAPGTFGTKTEAARWLSMLEADMLRGVWIDPARGDVRFGEVAERWLATKVHLRDSTRALYHWLVTKHILPTFSERPIGSIRRSTSRYGSPTATPTPGSARTAWPRPTRSSEPSWSPQSTPA